MSVPNQTPIVEAVANGNTVTFPYNFYVLRNEDLDVFVAGFQKTEGTEYTVTGIGNAQGGNVTFTAAAKPAAGERVMIKRQTPVQRTTNYTYLGDLQASDLNDDFDRLWLALQEQRASFGSSISRPAGGVGNWDAQGFALTNMKDGTQPQDAVTYKQLFTVNGNADAAAKSAAANAAQTALDRTATGADRSAAAASESNASTSAQSAAMDAGNAQKWAANPVDAAVANGLFSSMHYATKAAGSAQNALDSETNSANSAASASQSSTSAAGSAAAAKTEADKLGNMNQLAAAIQSVTNNNVLWKGTQSTLLEGGNDGDYVTVRQLRAATAGGSGSAALINGVMNNFIGGVQFFNGSRTAMFAGHLPGDGQILNRADYPELWAAVAAGLLNSVSDALWLDSGDTNARYKNRGKYSTGNGSTTFRLPDYNGVQDGSLDGLFLRGNNGKITAVPGDIVINGLPNLTGELGSGSFKAMLGHKSIAVGDGTGALRISNAGDQLLGAGGDPYRFYQFSIDASKANAAYGRAPTEVRPNAVFGIWVIRVNGSFTAANTNFSVFNGAASAPANGVVVYGGDLMSKYQVSGADYAGARLRTKVTGGATPLKQVAIGLQDGATATEWLLPSAAGTLAGRNGGNAWSGTQDFADAVTLKSAVTISGPAALTIGGGAAENGSGSSFWSATYQTLKLSAVHPNPVANWYMTEDVGVRSGLALEVRYGSSQRSDYKFADNGTATAVQWQSTSDGQLKRKKQRLVNALAAAVSIGGVSWEWDRKGMPAGAKGVGVIAQHVQDWFPELVDDFGESKKADGTIISNCLSVNNSAYAAGVHGEAIATLFDIVEMLANGDTLRAAQAASEVRRNIKTYDLN